MRSYFQYITSILVNVQCIKWKRTRITCGVNSTIWQQAHSLKKGGGWGYFMGGCMLVWGCVSGEGCVVWHCVSRGGGWRGCDTVCVWMEGCVWCDTVCVDGGVCGVTLSGVDGCVCGVTLCVCPEGDGWVLCDSVSGGGWMGLWCDA